MRRRDELDDIVEKTAEESERERISPERHQDLKDAVFGEKFEEVLFADVSYFVVGSYGHDEKQRLLLVRDELRERDGAYAFLMNEMPEAWEYWTTKFVIFATRADYVVGVFEHNRGGHEWEAGQLDRGEYRPKTHILKREYDSKERDREHFDAMFVHYLAKMDEQLGQCIGGRTRGNCWHVSKTFHDRKASDAEAVGLRKAAVGVQYPKVVPWECTRYRHHQLGTAY